MIVHPAEVVATYQHTRDCFSFHQYKHTHAHTPFVILEKHYWLWFSTLSTDSKYLFIAYSCWTELCNTFGAVMDLNEQTNNKQTNSRTYSETALHSMWLLQSTLFALDTTTIHAHTHTTVSQWFRFPSTFVGSKTSGNTHDKSLSAFDIQYSSVTARIHSWTHIARFSVPITGRYINRLWQPTSLLF